MVGGNYETVRVFVFPLVSAPLSVKLCTEHGDTESDSLCAALKLSFKHMKIK